MRTSIQFLVIILVFSLNSFAQDELILDDLNPNKFNLDFNEYNQNTALFCGQISEVAYWDYKKIESLKINLQTKYPTEKFELKLIDDRHGKYHNQALIFLTKSFLIVSFRGTEPKILKDWVSDAKFWNYENSLGYEEELSNMPPGHGGFRRALMRLLLKKNLINEIKKIIQENNSNTDLNAFPIYLTGHSLGAGIAQLFIGPLKYNNLNYQGSYHFAPPLAVSCSVNKEMKANYGNVVYDIVNFKDYVPRAGRNDVGHFGKFYRICDDHLVYKETESYVAFNWNEYFTEFGLHALKTHLKYLRRFENNIDEINKRSIGHTPCMELDGTPSSICN